MFALFSLSLALASTTASSSKSDAPASAAVDGLLQTAWMENAAGYGKDESYTLKLNGSTEIKTLSIWPGNLSNGSRSFRQYSRPKQIRILIDGEQSGEAIRLLDKPQRLDVDINSTGRNIQILIDEVFEGVVYADLAIAEIAINFPSKETATRLDKWKESRDGTRKAEAFKTELNEYYNRCKSAEFGDKEAFEPIAFALRSY